MVYEYFVIAVGGTEGVLRHISALPLCLRTCTFRLGVQLREILPTSLLSVTDRGGLHNIGVRILSNRHFSLNGVSSGRLSTFKSGTHHLGLSVRVRADTSSGTSVSRTITVTLGAKTSSMHFCPHCRNGLHSMLSVVTGSVTCMQRACRSDNLAFAVRRRRSLGDRRLISLIGRDRVRSLSLLFSFTGVVGTGRRPVSTLGAVTPRVARIRVGSTLVIGRPNNLNRGTYVSNRNSVPFGTLLARLVYLNSSRPRIATCNLRRRISCCTPTFHFRSRSSGP